MKNKKSVLICIDAMFLAIILIMTFTPLGFITLFGVVSNTLIHIPVLIGALLLGKKRGLLYGTFFGFASFFKALISPVGLLDPFFVNPLISILPRMLFGYGSGIVFDLIKKLKFRFQITLVYLSSFLLTIFHSLLTLSILGIVYFESINNLIEGYYSSILLFISGVLLSNGIIEGILALVSVPLIYLATYKYIKKI